VTPAYLHVRVAAASGDVPIQVPYFCTRAPTCGSAAAMCLAAPPRTARYALRMVGRSEDYACLSVTESSASDTSSLRLTR
jgi:hypothetical protein